MCVVFFFSFVCRLKKIFFLKYMSWPLVYFSSNSLKLWLCLEDCSCITRALYWKTQIAGGLEFIYSLESPLPMMIGTGLWNSSSLALVWDLSEATWYSRVQLQVQAEVAQSRTLLDTVPLPGWHSLHPCPVSWTLLLFSVGTLCQ